MVNNYKSWIIGVVVMWSSLGHLVAQTYPMDGTPINACGGIFELLFYPPNTTITTTICSDGSSGTHIRLFFQTLQISSGDQICFFDGPTTAAPQLSCGSDFFTGPPFYVQATAANISGCLTVVFTSDAINPNESNVNVGFNALMDCIPACQTIQSELISTDPLVEPVDTGYMDACPDQRLFFSGRGLYPQNGLIYNHSDFTSSFEWDFGDGTFAVGPDVSHTYDDPGGYVVQLTITDQFGCRNTNFLNQRVRISSRPQFMLGDVLPQQICAGDTLNLNAIVGTMQSGYNLSVLPTSGSFQTGGTRSDSLPLPDGTGAVYETSIGITDFSPGQVLSNINDLESICVNMEHSWMHDLNVFIECPNGTQVTLQNQEFIGNEVFLGIPYELDDFGTPNPPGQGVGYDYCWTPTATRTWTNYTQTFDPQTLPAGDYASYETLNNLIGCPLNGEWTIIVQDQWASDNGWIFEWSINFNPAIYPELEVFTPEIIDYSWQNNPSIFFQTQDSISASPQNAGTAQYTFSVTNEYGCTYDTSLQTIVLPETHPNCHSCEDLITPEDDIVICDIDNAPLDVSAPVETQTQVTFEAFPDYPLGFANHPPINPYYSGISVNSIRPLTLTSPTTQIVSVCIDISTNWNSDLDIFLRAPTGQLLELSTDNGGGSDNYTQTCFTPTAVTPITASTGPFTGNFRPEGNWNVLNGVTVNGNWQLVVTDAFGINDVGNVNWWSITFNSTNTVNYVWTPSAGLSCANCPNPVADPNVTTTYRVTASDSYGCVARDTITVGIISSLSAPDVTCLPTGSGEITFNWTPVGNISAYEIRLTTNGVAGPWQGPVTDLSYIATGLVNGDIVTLEVRANTGGASLNCPIDVGSSTCEYGSCGMSGTATNIVPANCFGQSNGSVSINVLGGDLPFSYALDGGASQSLPNFSGLPAGNHFVVVSDVNDCRDSVFFVINQPQILQANLALTQLVSCHNGNNGIITATAQGGNGGFTYSWNGATPTANNVNSGLIAGAYNVLVTDNKGCTANASISLPNPQALTLAIDATNPLCAGSADGQAQAFATGGTGTLNYHWSSGANQAIATQLTAGNQCVTVTDANGCTIADCEVLVAPSAVTITNITSTPVDCNGNNTGTALVSASGGVGGYTYQWDDPLQQLSSMAVFLEAGNYSVVVTDANGCSASTSIGVNEPNPIVINFNVVDVLCFGGADGLAQAIPVGGVPPYNYNWETGPVIPSAGGLAAGTYTVTVTDNNGCVAQNDATVEQPASAVQVVATQSFRSCNGAADNEATAMGSGGTGNSYSYSWSNQQNGVTIINQAPGDYIVTATDVNGCTARDTVTLTDWPVFSANIIANSPSCYGYNDGVLGINQFSGGAGQANNPADYTFIWSSGQSGLTTQNLIGNTTYYVTITDHQGCSGVISRFLPQPNQITFQITSTDVLCNNGADGTASVVDISGDNGGYTFSWDVNAGSQNTGVATGLSAGQYAVTVTDSEGCFNAGTVQVNQPTALAIKLEPEDNKCYGGSIGAIVSIVSGGVPGYTYDWSNQSTDANLGELAAGDYTLTITDSNGCKAEAETTVEQPDPLLATLASQDVSCYGNKNGRINITAQGGTQPYQYSLNNQQYGGSSTLIGLGAGTYVVYVRDVYNCLFFDEISVAEPAEFIVDAGPDINAIIGDTIQLLANASNAVGTVEFVWSEPYAGTLSCTECQLTQVLSQNTASFEVYAVDANGCEDTDIVHVFIKKPRVLEVPSGFTPNADNLNDRLMVHGQEGTTVELFQVFDRWGELLFEAKDFQVNDTNIGWDGLFRGETMNSGVYIWYVVAIYADGERESKRGETTLIR